MSKPRRERDDAPMEPERGSEQVKLLAGRIASVLGLLLVLGGVISVFTAQSAAAADISAGAVGALLGVVGYFLGARRLGLAATILGVGAIFLSLAATQGIVPGAPEGKQNLFRGPSGDPEP